MKHKCNMKDCKKKLSLVETITNKCKCGNIYCISHKTPECHNCNYDYKSEAAAEIMKNACKTSKIIKI